MDHIDDAMTGRLRYNLEIVCIPVSFNSDSAVNFDLSDVAFQKFRDFLHGKTGIYLADNKKTLIIGRLSKRLRHLEIDSFDVYFDYVMSPANREEQQVMLDLLTTNETYFFREQPHFDYLRELLLQRRDRSSPFRVWSAACSTGEEPYSIAMVLDDVLGAGGWEMRATDISNTVLGVARLGVYNETQIAKVPPAFVTRYFEPHEGGLVIKSRLKERIGFHQLNLNGGWPGMGRFDVIFLRNVMIYFTVDTKSRLVERMAGQLSPGGHLFIGHTESLHGVTSVVRAVKPAVYVRG